MAEKIAEYAEIHRDDEVLVVVQRRERGDGLGLCEIGFRKRGEEGEFGVAQQEFLVVDHQKTVHLIGQDLDSVERPVYGLVAFKEKWRGHHGNCDNAQTVCDSRDDRCATGAHSATETGEQEQDFRVAGECSDDFIGGGNGFVSRQRGVIAGADT